MRKPGKYGDSNGLWLYVGKPGQARWFLHYTAGGKARQMSLGSAEHLALADARDKAAEARRLLAQGIDPIEQRRQTAAAAELDAPVGAVLEGGYALEPLARGVAETMRVLADRPVAPPERVPLIPLAAEARTRLSQWWPALGLC